MLITTDMVAQRRYARSANAHHQNGLAIGPTVLRGLRDIGYRDTAGALAALIDNAIDGGAKRIDVVIEARGSAPTAIAVIDNGYGMVPEMMRAACAVGVTCRLGEGPHFARNGFGLPSAPFAVGRRFDLLSCSPGMPLHGLTMDLAEIDANEVPEALRATLPAFVADFIAREARSWSSGTIVVIEDIDRASPQTATRLRDDIQRHLSFVFARALPSLDLRIDGERLPPIDPVMLSPAGTNCDGWRVASADRFHVDIDGIEVAVSTARLAPAGIASSHDRPGAGRQPLFDGARPDRHLGLAISRLGRRLTSLATSPLFTFGSGDWRIRAELDFPPELDELFTPALSLQQVHVGDTVWRELRAAGIAHHLESLRRATRQERIRGEVTDTPVALLRKVSPRRRNRCQK